MTEPIDHSDEENEDLDDTVLDFCQVMHDPAVSDAAIRIPSARAVLTNLRILAGLRGNA
jgi:hypothetical protein